MSDLTNKEKQQIRRLVKRELRVQPGVILIADDDVAIINLREQGFIIEFFTLTGSGTSAGILSGNGSTNVITEIATASGTNVNVTTGVLTGTTGQNNKLTFSVDNGTLYIENRLGNERNFRYIIRY